ncbi:PREDICTED: zinc transporter ZIP13 isoform X2 [Thamnophis sirtalis]|uniref:Zinc transporter ZIP13 n=1 Tax=Thamnophis sirtalis TaxID=35019 RepID=A0A6I9XA41_9SAUR|nr:PREDICTED: zinc transporter ZIP13 isoform X2 [Thamnophis sirtalis]
MMEERLLLRGILFFLLLNVVCQAQDLPQSHATPGTSSLCEKDAGSWRSVFSEERLDAWICSLIGSFMVGLSGVLPLLFVPLEVGAALKSEEGSHRMKQLLSFAVGGLLGNVFLHLLPEAWAYTCSAAAGEGQSFQQQKLLGLWVIIGLLTFLSVQKMFPDSEKQGSTNLMSGYLNLLANTIDNFTHGLAVAASFLVSRKVGLLTTLAILLHEIPHEVGDFVILLRAGFDRWSAAKLQLSTALGGILGACFAICTQSPKGTGETIAWILPFTSGGFLYIALVNVVPDLLEEKNVWNSVQQVLCLCAGIVVMVLFSFTTN